MDTYNFLKPDKDKMTLIRCIWLAVGVLILCLLLASVVWAEEICIPCIIQIESSGNPNAMNKGHIGLMQVSSAVLKEWNSHEVKGDWTTFYCLSELWKPEINIVIGTWYIEERIPKILKAFGIPDTTDNRLIAYNFGAGNLRKYLKGEKKLPKETKDYLRKYHRLEKGVEG